MGDHTSAPREDPRVTRSKAQVVAATLEILREEGSSGLTIEKVAARSGVAKTTIYRQWANRDELMFDALTAIIDRPPSSPPGDLRTDIERTLVHLADGLKRASWAPLLPTIMDASERDPELAAIGRSFATARRAPLRSRLDRAVADGDLRAGLDTDLLAAQLAGPLFYRRFVSRQAITPAVVAQVVDTVLAGAMAGAVVNAGPTVPSA